MVEMKKPRRRKEKRFTKTIRLGMIKMVNGHNGNGYSENAWIKLYPKDTYEEDLRRDLADLERNYDNLGIKYTSMEIPVSELPLDVVEKINSDSRAVYFCKVNGRTAPGDLRIDGLERCVSWFNDLERLFDIEGYFDLNDVEIDDVVNYLDME